MAFFRLLKRWAHEQKGVGYLEFALCLPVLLLFLGGSIDVTRMVLLHQKVDKAVFTVGDLVTRLQTVSNVCPNIQNLEMNVVRDMVKPFSWEAGNFEFVMSAVIGARKGGNPANKVEDLIEWRYNPSVASEIGGYAGPYQSVAKLPATIQKLQTDERVIVTEMRYTFTPMLPLLSGLSTQRFHKTSILRARQSTGAEAQGSGVLSKLGC